MRTSHARVARVAVLAVLAAVLLGGCELREGDPREYGAEGVGTTSVTNFADQELVSNHVLPE